MRENWVTLELGDLCNFIGGGTPSKKEPKYWNGNIPWASIKDIKGQYLTTTQDFITQHGLDNSAANIALPNEIILATRINPGKPILAKIKTAINQDLKIARPKIGIENNFFYYLLKSCEKEIVKVSSGTTVLGISLANLKKIVLSTPSRPEQRAIVAKIEQLFSELDNGIANLKAAQDKLDIYRQAVLKKAFEGELTKEWRKQQTDLPTADELLQQIKQERQRHYAQQLVDWEQAVEAWEAGGKVGEKPVKPRTLKEVSPIDIEETSKLSLLPEQWMYHYLAYGGDLGRGKSKHRPRNDKKLFGGAYPFIQTAEVKAQSIVTRYNKTYNELGLAQSKIWPEGTLCITIAANIAETAFLGFKACFPDSIVGFSPYTSIVKSKYIEYFFRSVKKQISAWAPATAQKNINLTTLENLIIPFCCIEEQIQIVQEIESRLSVCDNLATTIKQSLQQAEALRQSILKKAFEGRLLSAAELDACRAEPDWEPAAQLLRRIQQENKQ